MWQTYRALLAMHKLISVTLGQTPPGFLPETSRSLGVTFNHVTVPFAGAELSKSDVQSTPSLDLSNLGSCSSSTYIVIMIDIDVSRNGRTTNLLHWYQPDILMSSRDHQLVPICSERRHAVYGPPTPPDHLPHRYVELLFKQPENFSLPKRFERFLEPNIPARLYFNVTELVTEARLGDLVAANYFVVRGQRVAGGLYQIAL